MEKQNKKPAEFREDAGSDLAAPTAGASRSVLLMDDEESILRVTGRMLELLGYAVSCARHGMEAVELFADALEKGSPFDAVIMDLTIRGGLGGKSTVIALRQIMPDVRVIVSSGYSNDPIMSNYREYGFSNILFKPYRIEDLGHTLSQTLGADVPRPLIDVSDAR
ncbi:MAG TPA: response regulator [Spirochaetota bacterium]|nr:response regulator [Spirochaetota bacterium]